MFVARISMGKLCEARIASPFTLTDFTRFENMLRAALLSAPGKVVGCADFRKAAVFTQDVAQRLVALLKSDNPMVERTGILVSPSAVFSMQMERILRGASNPNRRTFRASKECVAWLSELLSPEEQIALQRFVAS